MKTYNTNEAHKVLKDVYVVVGLLIVFLLNTTISRGQNYGDFPYEQSFLSTTQPEEITKPRAGGAASNSAAFTANGVQLTSPVLGQFGAIFVNNRRFSSVNGVRIEFEYMMYGGSGGDGISMFLFNADSVPAVGGAPGAGIGYVYNLTDGTDTHKKHIARGLKGGYMAVALDAFGNFKGARYQGESRVNGIPYLPGIDIDGSIGSAYNTRNQVTIRGAALDRVIDTAVYRNNRRVNVKIPVEYGGFPALVTQSTNAPHGVIINYTNGTYTLRSNYTGNRFNISGGSPFSRPNEPAYRKAIIDLYPVPDNVEGGGFYVTVKIQHGQQTDVIIKDFHYKEGFWYNENALIPGWVTYRPTDTPLGVYLNAKIPTYMRVGFAASTGEETNYHVIKNVRITLPGAAEAYDDAAITRTNTPIDIDVFQNDLAYQGIISENMIGKSEYINPTSFKFHLADGSNPDGEYTHVAPEGTWTYDPATGLVAFTPGFSFEGEASIQYSIKGGLPGHTEPFADEAYRSLPATITVTVEPDCPFLGLTNGIVYVKDYRASTGGVRDGKTWETAYDTLAHVLKAAQNFPGCIQEIWVAKGTYYPMHAESGNTYEYYTFNLVDEVKMYGGFAGTETSINGRTDIHGVNRTILSGDLDNDDDYGIINYNSSNENAVYAGTTNNVYHVVTSGTNVTSATVLDGFTIEGGNARNEDHYVGGGVFLTDNTNPSLSNLIIRYNRGTQGGGGIANSSTEAVSIADIKIHDNIGGEYGAGFYSDGNSLTLRQFDVYDNILSFSDETTGSTTMGGGGFALGRLHLLNGKITGNNGAHLGGGLCVGADYTTTNVTIADNSAENIGGLVIYGTVQGAINNTIFWGNTTVTGDPNIGYFNSADPLATMISYSILQGSGGSSSWNNDFGNNQGNNLDADPLFTGQGKYAYRLSTGSPAVDAGNNSLYTTAGGNLTSDRDLSDETRLKGAIIDMGAYEGEFFVCPVEMAPDANGILYVDYTKDGNGSSWQCALADLSDALSAAERINASAALVKVQQIWVAKGIYYPRDTIPGTPASITYPLTGRDRTFRVLTDIKLYGGFRGADGINDYMGETAINQRTDIHGTNETVLSGDVENTPDDDSDDVYHVMVVLNDAEDVDVAIDGFTIEKGNTVGGDYSVKDIGNAYVSVSVDLPRDCGGGISVNINNNSILTLDSNIVRNNKALFNGGGVYVDTRTVENTNFALNNNLFEGNSAYNAGGLYSIVYSTGSFIMDNNRFLNNTALGGFGGVCVDFKEKNTATISNNLIQGNTAGSRAGGLYIYILDGDSAVINNNIVRDNILENGGSGAGMYINSRRSTLYITGNIIDNNISRKGGGIRSNGGGIYANADYLGNIIIKYNTITRNQIHSAAVSGAGVYAVSANGNITIDQNTIENNVAFASGESESIALGGGIYAKTSLTSQSNSRILISYNHINKNSLGSIGGNDVIKGGGIYITYELMASRRLADRYDSIDISQTSGITVINNLLAGNNITGDSTLGGGIHADFGFFSGYIAAVTNIVNNTITSNTISVSGGAGINLSDGNSTGGTANVYNNIIWNNTFGAQPNDLNVVKSGSGSTLNIKNNLVRRANLIGFTLDTTNLVGMGNNPLFIDAANTDVSSNNYNLQDGSPAIDLGNRGLYYNAGGGLNNADLNLDKPRIVGGNIDAGAYEGFSEACDYYGVVPDPNGIVYVKDYTMPNAGIQPADANGSSWEKAHPNLADVIQSVLDGCLVNEIWVAEGTYYPKYDVDGIYVIGTEDSRNATFRIPKNIKVYGGFMGNEATFAERPDPNPLYGNSIYTSILSGDIDRDVKPDDYSSTETSQYDMGGGNINLIIYSGTQGNSYNVVFFTGDVSTSSIDGFTIQGGNANAPMDEVQADLNLTLISGGGICFDSISFPTLENLSVQYNHGIYAGGLFFVDMLALDGNSSFDLTTPLIINNIVFNKNISPIISAVFSAGYLKINNFDIKDNEQYMRAEPNGTVVAMGKLDLRNGKITDNKNYAGALHIFCTDISEPSYRLTNITISNNKAVNGAGLSVWDMGTNPAAINGYVHNSIIFGNVFEYDDEQISRTIISGERNVFFNAASAKQYIQNSLIGGSGGSSSWDIAFGNNQGSNIDTDPQFTKQGRYPYQLFEESPAVNTGNNYLYTQAGGNITTEPYDLEIAGRPRLIGTTIDMGAYEGSCPLENDSILYVNIAIPIAGDGSGWSRALNSLAYAMQIASRCSTVKEIWVAKGVYLPKYHISTGVESNNRDVSFLLPDGVSLYGGFPEDATDAIHGAGDNPAVIRNDITKRNWEQNPTILSGDIGVKDDYSDNAYHVVISGSNSQNTVMDGFTVAGGNANGDDWIIIHSGDSIFRSYGGGVYTANSSIRLSNMHISGNMSETSGWTYGYGGGMYVIYASQAPSLVNVLISGNAAYNGGGAYIDNIASSPISIQMFTNVTIAGNNAVNAGGGIYSNNSTASIVNSILWNNGTNNIFNSSSVNKLNFANNIAEGSGGSANWAPATGIDGGNNLDSDPLFILPGDPADAPTMAGNYRLGQSSSAFNIGNNNLYLTIRGVVNFDNEVDLSGNLRLKGTTVDAGAYESDEILYILRGTVFPFVQRDSSPDFNSLFKITANLYTLPTSADPFAEIKAAYPLYTDTLVLYDGTTYVPGTPKFPGVIGNTNNPGVSVTWSMVGKETGIIDDTEVGIGEKPEDNVGLYTFENVQAGDYLLVISRPGYITRYAKITVANDGTLGHRELLAGDINEDRTVSVTDLSLLNANFAIYGTDPYYNVLYDLDGEGNVDPKDVQILLTLLRASFLMYTDSYDWLMNY